MESVSSISCPLCGGPLADGYVNPPRGLTWTEDRAGFTLRSDYVWLASPRRLRYPNLLARRCTRCRLVLLRYP